MDLSIFLAKAFGLYMTVLSLGLLMNARRMKSILMDSMDSPPLLLLSGVIALIVGILIVISHNVWVSDWRVIITIVGWLALLKGINLILFPNSLVEISKKWIENNSFYYITMFIYLLFGIYLTYIGFFLNPF
jgi:uncharacterized membrane protein HdeD (DUF308 family)